MFGYISSVSDALITFFLIVRPIHLWIKGLKMFQKSKNANGTTVSQGKQWSVKPSKTETESIKDSQEFEKKVNLLFT